MDDGGVRTESDVIIPYCLQKVNGECIILLASAQIFIRTGNEKEIRFVLTNLSRPINIWYREKYIYIYIPTIYNIK